MKQIFIILCTVLSFPALGALETKTPIANVGVTLFFAKNMLLVQNAAAGNTARVLALLNLPSINVNHKDASGHTAFYYARQLNDQPMIKALVAKGAIEQ